MSRALNINATLDDVTAACAKHAAPITAIETLPGGCTRVVLANGNAAAIIRRAFAKNILVAPQARTPLALASRNIPFAEVRPPAATSRFAPTAAGKR